MSETRKIASNTGVQVLGRILSGLLAIFTISAVLQAFGAELQGRYMLAMAFAQFVSTIADFGLGAYLVRAISSGNTLAKEGMTFRFYTAIPFYITAVIVSLFLPYDQPTREAIWVALISAFMISMNNTLVVYYQAKLKMHIPVFSEVVNKVVVFALTAAVIALALPFIWSVVVVVVGAMVNFLINFIVGRKDLPYTPKAEWSSWKEIIKETLPLWVVSVLILIYFRIDTLLLSVLPLPNGQNNLVEVGYYSTAYKLLELLIAIPMMFYGAVLPVLVAAQGDSLKLRNIISKALQVSLFISLPISVFVFMNSRGIIDLFFPNYEPAAAALSILIWAFLLSAISTGFYFSTISQGQQRRLVRPYLLATAVNVILNIWLIPIYGFYGAAWATVITELLIVGVTYQVSRSISGIGFSFDKSVIKILLAVTIMAIVGIAVPPVLWLQTICAGASYALVLLALKGIDFGIVKSVLFNRDV